MLARGQRAAKLFHSDDNIVLGHWESDKKDLPVTKRKCSWRDFMASVTTDCKVTISSSYFSSILNSNVHIFKNRNNHLLVSFICKLVNRKVLMQKK